MQILVTGASGLIGSELTLRLRESGDQVVALSRLGQRPASNGGVWDPATGRIEIPRHDEWDGILHLAGESIAGRWTAKKQRDIRNSRLGPTERLCAFVAAQMSVPPRVMVCASAIGFYGDRGEEVLTEESASGIGFLPEVCREWERATEVARRSGIRVVNARFGMVLSARGGALNEMLPVFRMGLGGKMGSGQQFWSWVSVRDAASAIRHCLVDESVAGPVNVVAPEAMRNADFTKTLGRVLGRPTVLAVPQFAARLALGEMADELLFASARVEPRRLLTSGFEFRHPGLEGALRDLLKPAAAEISEM